MLLGLWIARNDNQVRGVMVAGASCLLALSIWLTIDFIQARAGGDTSEMLHTYAVDWFKPLNIQYAVGSCCSSRASSCSPVPSPHGSSSR